MEKYGLISELKSYAEENQMAWIYGDNFHRNIELSKNQLIDNQLILGSDPFIAIPKFTNHGKLEAITYNGLMLLGIYTDVIKSTIDETYQQKYDNRLKELMQLLSTHIIAFSCDNELTILNSQFELSINTYDENIDFVLCSISLLDEKLS